jgi:hypothetical protein
MPHMGVCQELFRYASWCPVCLNTFVSLRLCYDPARCYLLGGGARDCLAFQKSLLIVMGHGERQVVRNRRKLTT